MPPISDVHRLRELQSTWFPDRDGPLARSLHTVFDDLGFTETYISNAAQLAKAALQRSKVIKDNVWGMIEIDACSVRLIDSPIVQRLRGIKQLGFSYLTYPSAEHSRFAHSLGMFAVVSRFLDAMKNNAQKFSAPGVQRYDVDASLSLDLLHAAILHDVGHLPFSHAGEVVFRDLASRFCVDGLSVDDFLFEIKEKLGRKLQFSEGLSLAILLSPRFHRFYSECIRPEAGEKEATLRVATLIAGLRPQPALRSAADLISSSAVDADKVDYINRDALACGIPVGIDVARLFLRSAFLNVEPSALKKLLPEEDILEREVIFIVNASGVDTIEELAQARASLYQRVYLHQTTRNAERLLAHSLEALTEDAGQVRDPLSDAIHLLGKDDLGLLKELSRHAKPEVSNPAMRLRNRDLPKRSCIVGRKFVNPFVPVARLLPLIKNRGQLTKLIVGTAIEQFRHDVLFGEKLIDLERQILEEAARLRALLIPTKANILPISERPGAVAVVPMKELDAPPKDCIVLENHQLIHSSDRLISEEQNDAAEIYKSLGYVLSDQDWREVVCLAARKVIEESFSFGPSHAWLETGQRHEVSCFGSVLIDLENSMGRAGLRAERVHELNAAAERARYYDARPQLSLAQTNDAVKIARVASAFDGQGGWKVTPETARAFLSQFPPSLRNEFVELFVKHFVMLDRTTVAATLRVALVDLRGSISKGVVVALSPNSGSFIRMLAEQDLKVELGGWGWRFEKSVDDAVEKLGPDETLVFCDDNIASGTQSTCQFRAWMGVPRDQWPREDREEHGITETSLSEDRKAKLRTAKVAFAYCAGPASFPSKLPLALRSLGIDGFVDAKIGRKFVVTAAAESPELETFLRNVGSSVLSYCRFGKVTGISQEQKARCDSDAAGYSGARAWIATLLSVPTATYPALWCPGMYNSRPWLPLLIRRGYLNKLIVY